MPLPDDGSFIDINKPDIDEPYRVGNEISSENSSACFGSTFSMLNGEMEGRVEENSKSVWDQLKVDEVEDSFVVSCCEKLRRDCSEDIANLRDLTDESWNVVLKENIREDAMYPFLVRPLSLICVLLSKDIDHFRRNISLDTLETMSYSLLLLINLSASFFVNQSRNTTKPQIRTWPASLVSLLVFR